MSNELDFLTIKLILNIKRLFHSICTLAYFQICKFSSVSLNKISHQVGDHFPRLVVFSA